LEIPAGGIDPGEEPEDAVKRELQEEIGHIPASVEPAGGFFSSPGFSTEYLFLYYATDLKPARLVAEDTAGIETVKIRPDQVLPLIQSGDIRDAKSIAGLLLYLSHRAAVP
jgi:ADP-ribose pyrophosphatase